MNDNEWPLRARWVKFSDRLPQINVSFAYRSSADPGAGMIIEDWFNDDDESSDHMMNQDGESFSLFEIMDDGWEWLEIAE